MGGKDVSNSVIPCFTEEEIAAWRARRGFRVVRHLGRCWSDLIRGFYQPLHHLARFSLVEATALKTSIGAGLLFEFVRCCRRTAGVREVSYGIEAPEKYYRLTGNR